jgi:WD40 repeat protein
MSKSDLSTKLREIEQTSATDVLKHVLEAAEQSQGNADHLSQIAQVIHSRNLLPDLLRSLLSLDKQSDKNNQVELLSTLIQDQQNLIRKLTQENKSLREDVTDLKDNQVKYSVDEEYLKYSNVYAREVEERARLKLSIDDERGVQTIEAGSPVTCAVSLHDGNLIATSHDGAVKIWDLTTQKLVREFANDVPDIWSLEPIKGTDLLFVASTVTIYLHFLTF